MAAVNLDRIPPELLRFPVVDDTELYLLPPGTLSQCVSHRLWVEEAMDTAGSPRRKAVRWPVLFEMEELLGSEAEERLHVVH